MKSTTSSTRTYMSTPATDEKPPKKQKEQKIVKFSRKKIMILVAIVLVVLAVALFIAFRQAQDKADNSGQAYIKDNQEKLSKLIILPANETPQVATVKDADKLKNQQFYANARNGDITFVYRSAKKAILYRPDTNLIVNVAPVSVN